MKSSRSSYSIFELCDVWTGDAGPSSALPLGELSMHGLACSPVLIDYVWSICKHYAVTYRRSNHKGVQGQVTQASWQEEPTRGHQ